MIAFGIWQLLPHGVQEFEDHIRRLKLVNLCERLSAKTALFDLLPALETEDDDQIIELLSGRVPELGSLDQQSRGIIEKCQNSSTTFDSSRETNIPISDLQLSNSEREAVEDLTRQLVVLAGYMFGGKDFTAKLYLRVKKAFLNRESEMLVAFSKFPLSGSNKYGSSWVKARGNPATVWQCLENSSYVLRQLHGEYYESVFAVCLPGRIGVLAFTGPRADSFDGKVDKSTAKALAFASRQLLLESLKGNGHAKVHG